VRADEALAFAAQQRGPIRLQATGPVHCFGLRLAAAASSLIAGTRLPALRDSAPDMRLIDDSEGDVRIGALAAQLGMPLRNLQARFLAAVGMSPKEYARVRRLRALLRTLDERPPSIADA